MGNLTPRPGRGKRHSQRAQSRRESGNSKSEIGNSRLEEVRQETLEDFVLAAEVTEGADVGDDESGGEAVAGGAVVL